METASSIGLGAALLAVPGVARAQSGPVKIGVMGPFTRPAARTGEAIQKGAQMAVADARENRLLPLTIDGQPPDIEIVYVNTVSIPPNAVPALCDAVPQIGSASCRERL